MAQAISPFTREYSLRTPQIRKEYKIAESQGPAALAFVFSYLRMPRRAISAR